VREPQVLEGAEEFRFGTGPAGVLMIHGFTGSPQGLRSLGEDLATRGLAVEGIRLPGHGTTWEDLNLKKAGDWRNAVEEGYETIARGRDEVFVVALSFGAALAVDFIASRPGRVAGLVTLAGFVYTDDPRRFFAPIVKRFVRSLPGVANDIADPAGREIAYDRVPAAAAADMLRVIRSARRSLPQVRCPVLVMHGRNDHTVKPANSEIIHREVASTDKELVWLDRSYHVVTLDYDREVVHRRTYDFIKEHSKHVS
jgi:carboxylesterase